MPFPSRTEIVQSFLDFFPEPNYLEIGVSQGATFFHTKARLKVAVDPSFAFDPHDARREHPDCVFYPVTSDAYFSEYANLNTKFDVIFLDGLHTFEQTLRDLLSAETYLNAGGVIIIDDVFPISYSASLKNPNDAFLVREAVPSERDRAWMGDVYRLVFFIETFMRSYCYAAVKDNRNHQIVMWRQKRRDNRGADRSVEDISRLEFKHCFEMIDSYRSMDLAEIVAAAQAARSEPTFRDESASRGGEPVGVAEALDRARKKNQATKAARDRSRATPAFLPEWILNRDFPLLRGLVTQMEVRRLKAMKFDQPYYLASNPDLPRRDFDPVAHFVRYGRRENRLFRLED